MKSFGQYIKESKNTHMTHIEDRVIYGGVKGAREAILAKTRAKQYMSPSLATERNQQHRRTQPT